MLRRTGLRAFDISWLLPSSSEADEAAIAPGPLARIVAELLIGGASSEIRREAAALLKAVWRLLESQSSVQAQQVCPSDLSALSAPSPCASLRGVMLQTSRAVPSRGANSVVYKIWLGHPTCVPRPCLDSTVAWLRSAYCSCC